MTATLTTAMFAAVLSAAAEGSAGSAPSTAPPSKDESVLRAQVNSYLGSNDVRPQGWRELGPAALPFVTKVATDRDAAPPRRIRAIQAISIIGSRSDAPLVVDLARSESEPNQLRLEAMRAAVKLMPKPDAVAALKPMLRGARTVRMRAAAAEQLTHLSRRQCSFVRAQAEREKKRDHKLFQRALRRCSARSEPSEAAAPAEPAPEQ